MDPVSAMLMGGTSLAGSLFQSFTNQGSQQATNQMQMQLAQQQQNFQEKMSNTAYQRATSDMKAAGLNPMMMFGSGSASSSPSGAMATLQAPKSDISGAVDRAVGTAVQAKVANATIDNLVQQNANLKASQKLTETQVPTEAERKFTEIAKQKLMGAETNVKAAGLPITQDEARSALNRLAMEPNIRKVLDIAGFAGKKGSEMVSPVSTFVGGARNIQHMMRGF